ncbi:hypothetical protein DFP72DRAFT_1077668 [Ephemerocybe angulata]|uniref:Uncharacterized protein n=1 Tax=Ephemerocybe angulata TaxID=980116 RepID=A0A8H6LVE9_9AGAR|nr:hypothetical protein DFP72DRAFT_1077668 [Tulosesus angulatus]
MDCAETSPQATANAGMVTTPPESLPLDAPDAPGPASPQGSEAQLPADAGPNRDNEPLWMTEAALDLYFDRFNGDLLGCRACDAEDIYTTFRTNTPRSAIQDHFQSAHPDLTELISYCTDELMVELKKILFE